MYIGGAGTSQTKREQSRGRLELERQPVADVEASHLKETLAEDRLNEHDAEESQHRGTAVDPLRKVHKPKGGCTKRTCQQCRVSSRYGIDYALC